MSYHLVLGIYKRIILLICCCNCYYFFFHSTGVNCNIQFESTPQQCLNQPVEYQCTVTGAVFVWRVFDDNGAEIAIVAYNNIVIASPTTTGAFTFEQLQEAPMIISNISFIAQSSINGYTIRCEDGTNNEDLVTSGVHKCDLLHG